MDPTGLSRAQQNPATAQQARTRKAGLKKPKNVLKLGFERERATLTDRSNSSIQFLSSLPDK